MPSSWPEHDKIHCLANWVSRKPLPFRFGCTAPGSRRIYESVKPSSTSPGVRARHAGLLAAVLPVLFAAGPCAAASRQQIDSFGDNPSNIEMYLYVPDNVAQKPAILVGVHWCGGTGPDFYSGTKYAALSDRYGFIVIYPSAVSSNGCWDVHSQATLTHNGGSDSRGIVSMVKYVEQNHNGDPNRVYVTGHSSGGMMTNVLLGAYPDVFKAGAASAGVPFGCFAGTDTWNTSCATGAITKTGQQWGDLVRAAYSSYTGPRPPIQLWHGTADDVLVVHNYDEEIKQWTNVLGVGATPSTTETNTPRANWTRTRYKDANGNVMVEATRAQGEPHNVPILADEVIRFFALDGSTAPVPGTGGAAGSSNGGK